MCSYDLLEAEIDGSVVRVAGSVHSHTAADGAAAGNGGGGETKEGSEAEEHALLRYVRAVPSNPERRVKQAVFLAQKLLETEKQRDEVRRQLAASEASLIDMKAQVRVGAIDF